MYLAQLYMLFKFAKNTMIVKRKTMVVLVVFAVSFFFNIFLLIIILNNIIVHLKIYQSLNTNRKMQGGRFKM